MATPEKAYKTAPARSKTIPSDRALLSLMPFIEDHTKEIANAISRFAFGLGLRLMSLS
jgi:hypothetical protein